MAREKKQRIPTEARPAAFANPFAALDIQGREADEAASEPPPSAPPRVPPGKERLLLRRSTAHRGGKTVLVLEGFSASWTPVKLDGLLRGLKSTLGCGGRVDDGRLELQGELADRLQPLLESRGFAVKRGW